VTEFSKKTGDYVTLSATDIKVMALTYQLEVESNGKEHLKTEPTIKKTIVIGPRPPGPEKVETLAGFYMPKAGVKTEDEIEKVTEQLSEVELVQDECNKKETHPENENTNEEKNCDSGKGEDEDEEGYDTEEECDEEEEENESEEEEEDEDGGWITPGNIQQVKHSMAGNTETVQLDVGCLTTDFAMQVGYINGLKIK
jgi:RNA-binding protein NOB1